MWRRQDEACSEIWGLGAEVVRADDVVITAGSRFAPRHCPGRSQASWANKGWENTPESSERRRWRVEARHHPSCFARPFVCDNGPLPGSESVLDPLLAVPEVRSYSTWFQVHSSAEAITFKQDSGRRDPLGARFVWSHNTNRRIFLLSTYCKESNATMGLTIPARGIEPANACPCVCIINLGKCQPGHHSSISVWDEKRC